MYESKGAAQGVKVFSYQLESLLARRWNAVRLIASHGLGDGGNGGLQYLASAAVL